MINAAYRLLLCRLWFASFQAPTKNAVPFADAPPIFPRSARQFWYYVSLRKTLDSLLIPRHGCAREAHFLVLNLVSAERHAACRWAPVARCFSIGCVILLLALVYCAGMRVNVWLLRLLGGSSGNEQWRSSLWHGTCCVLLNRRLPAKQNFDEEDHLSALTAPADFLSDGRLKG